MPSRVLRVGVAAALSVAGLLSGCSAISDLLGDDEPPPVVADPALVTVPEPVPVPTADPAPAPGGFTIPGLPGLSIPLPAPNQNHQPPSPPPRGTLAAVPPGSYDANGHMTRAFLESEAEAVHQLLVAALDAHEKEQVRAIPFEIVIQHREPNAAAGCTNGQRAVMMITSAMLELAAGISEAKAYDEVAGTETYEQYVATVVQQVRAQQPIQGVDPSAHRAPLSTDPHKLSRQRHLFDQQVAFIVGHELAHHYRGHTSCVAGRSEAEIQRDDLSRILAHTVPPFSQPREVEADMWGLTSVLEAGRGPRPTGTWSEEGALLNLDFFGRLGEHGGAQLIMAFLSTHPPSVIRIPIVESTAQQWSTGWRPPRMPTAGDIGNGQGIELPGPGGTPIRLPDPGQLGIDPSRFPFPIPRPRAPPR